MQDLSAVSSTTSKQGAELLEFELCLSFPESHADFYFERQCGLYGARIQ